jgi:hypothetical protein
MNFIRVNGYFESDCSDSQREFLINVMEIITIYQSIGRVVINLKNPIKEIDLKIDIYKIYVKNKDFDFNEFVTLLNVK